MSFSDDARELERSFVTTRGLLQQLLEKLQERRAAWVSVRPEVLAPSTDIEAISHALVHEEQRRAGLVRRLRTALPTPLGGGPEHLHVNVTRIAAALPTAEGRALRRAADEIQPLARAVRAETTLGQRLLRFARDAHDGVEARISGPRTGAKAHGYDRRARNVNDQRRAGQLVDGRI